MKKKTPISINVRKLLLLIIFFILTSTILYTESPIIKRLTGVNWFGFETTDYVPHGLWDRDYKSMLLQIKDLGFNCVRIPWSNEMLNKFPKNITISEWINDPYTNRRGLNTDLSGKSSLEVLDAIITEAGRLNLRIILDCHSRGAGDYMEETLWYTNQWPESRWISDWVFIAERYVYKPAVVAFDLNNEPHGGLFGSGMKPPASWGYDVPGYGVTNWKAAAERCAEAILRVNPDIIIIIQGVQESSDGSNYWWGSNHKDLPAYPVTSIPGSSLMYSVHEYGPSVASQTWFDDPTFPNNLEDLWRDRFWFIYEQNLAGLYIGEMGLKEEEASNPSSIAYKWFTRWLQFAGNKVHWTYWCWNPNSGDTGGILKDDWVSINTIKYNLIKPYLEPPNGVTPYPTQTPHFEPTPYPTQPPLFPTPFPTININTPYPTNPPEEGVIIDAKFVFSEDGFNYMDDPFRNTFNPQYASGFFDAFGGIDDGGLRVYLAGLNTHGATSAGWSVPFYSSGGYFTINFDYKMIFGRGYESNEYGEVIVSLDGNLHILKSISGIGDTSANYDTGWVHESLSINLVPGYHTLIIGVYNNMATDVNEFINFTIDNVRITDESLFPTSYPPPPDLIGDANNDGRVNILDSLIITQFYVGLNPGNFNFMLADVNCNNVVDVVDALLIAQYYVRLIDFFCNGN
ncbi:MAG: glycoside hydrolase family 5 protein [Spirochaetales bacterium]|nr:glycoside hydrolase family 5 protein [Spirochaetales bacterium]